MTTTSWGNDGDDNIVWGNDGDDNIVWGNSVTQAVLQIVFGDETREVNSLPAAMWDSVFPLDAQWPTTTTVPVVETVIQPITTITQPISTTTQQVLTRRLRKTITIKSLFGRLGGCNGNHALSTQS